MSRVAADDADTAEPVFVNASGMRAADPLEVTERPVVSLAKLARSLANPVLESNVGAPCLWQGVERLRPAFQFSDGEVASVGELRDQFAKAVSRSISDAETVVVLVSGGLDSLAVWVEVARQCRATGRRLVPVVFDMVDDSGHSALPVARRQAAVIGGSLPLVLAPHEEGDTDPEWSPRGPRSECHTGMWNRLYRLCERLPGSVVVTGEGGDEALAAWNFGTRSLLDARRCPDLRRYLAAFLRHETVVEAVAEVTSLGERALPRRTSFRLYMAMAWPDVLNPIPGDIIRAPVRDAVAEAHETWLRERFDVFCEQRQSWVEAMYYDQVYPFVYDAHPLDGPVPFRSPYCDPGFLHFAGGLPWQVRFDARTARPYHWYKALQLWLIPKPVVPHVPTYKMRYESEIDRHLRQVGHHGSLMLHELGVLRYTDFVRLESAHGFLPLAVRNAEMWLRGAVERGYAVSNDA